MGCTDGAGAASPDRVAVTARFKLISCTIAVAVRVCNNNACLRILHGDCQLQRGAIPSRNFKLPLLGLGP
jgi:hypothetical protein